MTSKLKDNFFNIAAVLAITIIVGLMGTDDLKVEQEEEAQYCEMVTLYRAGQGGWSDYKGIYDAVCKP